MPDNIAIPIFTLRLYYFNSCVLWFINDVPTANHLLCLPALKLACQQRPDLAVKKNGEPPAKSVSSVCEKW